tara:strand:- start:10144 stop:10929 length:786 start_codon:yes stop_codon:yes gene_type:complete
MSEKMTPRMLLTLAKESFENQEHEQAQGYLDQMLQEETHFADAHHLQGLLRLEKGEYQNALTSFRAAIAINPHYIEANLHLAITLSDIGEYDEANEIFQKVRTIREKQPAGLDDFLKNKIANLHAQIGDIYAESLYYSEASEEYKRALGLRPTYPDIRLKLANTLRDNNQFDLAVAEYTTIQEQHPSYLPALLNLGVLHYKQGDQGKAEAVWNQAKTLAPQDKRAEHYLRAMATGNPSPDITPPEEKDNSQTLDAVELLNE